MKSGKGIGIDAFGSDHGRSGTGSYLRGLAAYIPCTRECPVEFFGPEIDRYTFNRTRRSITYAGITLPYDHGPEALWHTYAAPNFIRKAAYDVVLFAAGSRLLPRGRLVLNSWISVGKTFGGAVAMTEDCPPPGDPVLRRLSRVDFIIAPSIFVRDSLVSSGIRADKITVIHHGLETDLFYPRSVGGDEFVSVKPFAILRPYLIYPSRIRGDAKKHVQMVKAFELFKEKTGAPHRLVLAGSAVDGLSELTSAVATSPVASDIVITGHFPHQSMPLLYAYADACVFPASREGVGLPVLEAMAMGIPVACSNSGALPEIAGDHVRYFDSADIGDMAEAMEEVVFCGPLREKLRAGGIEWSMQYRWDKTAEETYAILRFFC